MDALKVNKLEKGFVEILFDSPSKYGKLIIRATQYRKTHTPMIITISTSIKDFHIGFGNYLMSTKDKLMKTFDKEMTANDGFAEFIGRLGLDFYIEDTYFIRSLSENKIYEIRKVQ